MSVLSWTLKEMLFPIQLSEEKKVPTKVQLLKVGEFLSDDDKLEITTEILSSFQKNFQEKVRGYVDGKLPIDYFHENEKIAAGWIENLYIEKDGTELWADVKWTKRASEQLAEGELRYISVEYHTDYQHNEDGKKYGPTLFGAGLTNRPFIKGMASVASFAEKEKKEEYQEMTLEEAMKKIEELEAKIAEMGKGEKEMKEKLEEKKAEEEKAMAEKAAKEKEETFTKMLSEGKAVEAQRESFIAGDMVKFAELAQPLHTKASGTTDESKPEEKTFADGQDEILSLAKAKMEKNSALTLGEAISKVLDENKKLSEKYSEEVKLA